MEIPKSTTARVKMVYLILTEVLFRFVKADQGIGQVKAERQKAVPLCGHHLAELRKSKEAHPGQLLWLD